MFVFNLKLNLKNIVKALFIIMSIIVIMAFLFSTYKIIKNSITVKDAIKEPKISYIEPNNYTNVLNACYENLSDYVGKKISFSGYIYKNSDFKNNQFVLARDMTTTSPNKTYIVGFLCECNKLDGFNENDWVEITGKIEKGNYHGEIPIVKVKKIKKVAKPEKSQVPPPDKTYIPTSILF